MVPEFIQSHSIEDDRYLMLREPLIVDGKISSQALDSKMALIDGGVSPLLLIAFDESLARIVDRIPMEPVVEAVIPSLEDALIRGSEKDIRSALEFFPVMDFEAAIDLRYQQYRQLIIKSYTYGGVPFEAAADELGIRTGRFGDSPLAPNDQPEGSAFIKGFNCRLIRNSAIDSSSAALLQAKLTRRPKVTSFYMDAYSMSYYGFGVRFRPHSILRAHVYDLGSGDTTAQGGPNVGDFDDCPQCVDWDSLAACADIEVASQLGQNLCFYPEVWLDEASPVASVFLRPYTAWVTHSAVTNNDAQDEDWNRAVSAVMLSRALGIPIEILP